ncbi:fumarylacetoacetate hydrolase family protein [Streptomyces sp. NPDC057565]|uniref:fumarylacetoacetate hydrolase family protein n=1 Tax=Streptomyces sp. NPDC057565 TaxID=3346169 RepID=UPI0036CBB224
MPQGSHHTDWEVELGIVIGSHSHYLADAHEANVAIAGYVLVNDISERAFQRERGDQWVKGKFAPTMPVGSPTLAYPPDEVRSLRASLARLVAPPLRSTGCRTTTGGRA